MTAAAPADFGTDLDLADDLTDDAAEVSGLITLAQALYRRLSSPRGALWQDPHYGLDLRLYMSRAQTVAELAAIPRDVAAELKKDQRVDSVVVQVIKSTLFELVLSITVTTAAGPFSLTISATDAAVTLVSVSAAGTTAGTTGGA